MTIENQTSQVVYTTDGIAAAFPFAFFAPVGSIVVEVNDGETTTLIDKGDYTVTYNEPEGGTVTFPQAPQADLKLFISRIVEFVQEVDIQNQQRFYPEVIEGALDYLTMQTQQLKTETDRAVKALPGADVQEFVDSIFAAEKRAVDFAVVSKNWAESPTAPGDLDSKSSKTWALESAASATSAAASSAAAGAASGRLDVATFVQLATKFVYAAPGAGQEIVAAGDVILWRGKGFAYEVLASGASGADLDYTGSGGVKLQQVAQNNVYQMLALNPNADGVTDDSAKIDLLNVAGFVLDLGGKNYKYSGTWTAVAEVINGRIIDNDRTYDYNLKTQETASTVGQRRARVNYNTEKQVRLDGLPDAIVLGGFRSFGNYLKSKGPLVSTGLGANSHAIVDITTQLAGLNAPFNFNWYAVFAVAGNREDTCRFLLVPYFRVFSISGSVVTLGSGAENKNVSPEAVTYSADADAFADTDCLVVTQGGVVSRRVTQITASTTTTVTLADATGLAALDFLLPAPPGEANYHYLGSAFFEGPSGAWRNIADDGYNVRGRMVNISELPGSGAMSNSKVRLGGNIAPLATGFTGSLNATLSTTSLGNVSATLRHDSSNHDIWRFTEAKEVSANMPYNNMIDNFTFSKEQAFWATSGGSLAGGSEVSRTLLVYGWQEP